MIKPSLKICLLNAIKCYGGQIYYYSNMEELCRLCGRKVSNGERRLREMAREKNSLIEIVYHSEKNYIVGYRYKQVEQNGQVCLPV